MCYYIPSKVNLQYALKKPYLQSFRLGALSTNVAILAILAICFSGRHREERSSCCHPERSEGSISKNQILRKWGSEWLESLRTPEGTMWQDSVVARSETTWQSAVVGRNAPMLRTPTLHDEILEMSEWARANSSYEPGYEAVSFRPTRGLQQWSFSHKIRIHSLRSGWQDCVVILNFVKNLFLSLIF